MNKKLATAMVALMTLGMVASVAAQGANLEGTNTPDGDDTSADESSNVEVGVSSTTSIDVRPESLTFTGLEVGSQVTEETTGTNIFGSLTLENIGSEYIDQVWASASSIDSDPFGTGDPNNYNAGNFLQIKPANATDGGVKGDDSIYHYVNRYEFANSWSNSSSEIPPYIEADPTQVLSSGDAQDTYVGRIQAGDEWYFYTIATGTSNNVCDGSGNAVLRIGNSVHDSSNFGTVDFTNGGPGDYTELGIQTTSGNYGLADATVNVDVDGGSTTREYDILTQCDTADSSASDPHIIRTRYNVQAGGIADLTETGGGGSDTAGSTAQFLLEAGGASENLLPGEHLAVDTAIEVPQGVPQGDVQSGSITFYVTSDDSADVTN